MMLATEIEVKTLGNYAHKAIKKHLKKTLKWETSVKKDEDPEALHQMRVGMRRLRTAVSRFDLAVNLPEAANDKNIGKIGRRLGKLRDLDVLKETLERVYQPNLPTEEQEYLQKAFTALGKQRKDVLEDVQKTLKDERYKSIKTDLKDWLDKPIYKSIAEVQLREVIPDLLLPEISNFLLHPGWLVGSQVENAEFVVPTDLEAGEIDEILVNNNEVLHSLRKEAKRIRYQMELFTDLYGEPYAAFMADVKRIQEILGSMQDSVVLADWLDNVLKSDFANHLPTLADLFAQKRREMWQQWQPLQRRYLKSDNRRGLHLTILNLLG
ncbi:MAG: CHAD domain-containing protein [Scytonematopsis contorta HA4267-MV1]|jgi:CHAD domain-containing protein|nr:CHAD domain-containing protein [Scytonematopsis contorta HA4267-MV1]